MAKEKMSTKLVKKALALQVKKAYDSGDWNAEMGGRALGGLAGGVAGGVTAGGIGAALGALAGKILKAPVGPSALTGGAIGAIPGYLAGSFMGGHKGTEMSGVEGAPSGVAEMIGDDYRAAVPSIGYGAGAGAAGAAGGAGLGALLGMLTKNPAGGAAAGATIGGIGGLLGGSVYGDYKGRKDIREGRAAEQAGAAKKPEAAVKTDDDKKPEKKDDDKKPEKTDDEPKKEEGDEKSASLSTIKTAHTMLRKKKVSIIKTAHTMLRKKAGLAKILKVLRSTGLNKLLSGGMFKHVNPLAREGLKGMGLVRNVGSTMAPLTKAIAKPAGKALSWLNRNTLAGGLGAVGAAGIGAGASALLGDDESGTQNNYYNYG